MARAKQRNSSSSAARRRKEARQQRQGRQNVVQGQTPKRNNQRRTVSRRSPWLFVGGTLVLIALIVGFFIFLSSQSNPQTNGPTGTPVNATTFKQVTNVDAALLSQTGTGGLANPFKLTQRSPSPLIGSTGKPEIFYYGAEFCPFCAAERWGVVVAMSRFGTFQTLRETTSASNDSYPSTATFTFYRSSYTSSYIDFVSVEIEDQQRATLETPTPDEQKLVNTYDAPPYVDAQSAGGFPFIDIGNRYLVLGPSYDVGVLRTNVQDPNSTPLSQQEIASQLSTGNTLSKGVLGTANYLTAALCSITKNQPSKVCSDPAIQHIETTLSQTGQSNATSADMSLSLVADVRRRLASF